MIHTYEEYLTQRKALPMEQMNRLHIEIIQEIGTDKDAMEIYEELLKVAIQYASIRAEWFLMSREEKTEQDPHRTSCHDSVIIHFNMLSSYLKKQGMAASWRDVLGYEEDDKYCRKAIGDFACYLAFVNSINAR